MPTEAFASPLTVWIGSNRYSFFPGRDVTVGRDSHADIRIDDASTSASATSSVYLVLHHDGRQWVAVDRSERGIYVDGVRMSTVFIHDGRAITLGDPQHGPRLVFRLTGPAPPPTDAPWPRMRPAAPPPGPPQQAPHRWAPPGPPRPGMHPWAPSPLPPPQAHPQSTTALPPIAQHKQDLLVGRLTRAIRKLFPHRPKLQPHKAQPAELQAYEAPPTDPLRRLDSAAADAKSLRPAAKIGPLKAHQLWLTTGGEQALRDVSFTAGPGTLTAVVSPSEAGASALINVLSGALQPSFGTVTVDSHDVYAEDLRSRIGMVPQYDLAHPQLTVDQALRYAAELRLPPSAPADHRCQVVNWALKGLQLSSLRSIQAGNLSAEQRKRVSMAIELLTGPSLLLLDRPTAGQDPALQEQTMALLRRLADDGRVVVVATTSLTNLDMYDQVLLLTSTGTLAFAGAPADIGDAFGTTSWPEILVRVSTDPYGAHNAFLARQQDAPPEAQTQDAHLEPLAPAAQLRLRRQIAIAARRQAWLIAGDQRYLIFLTFLPLLFGAIALLVPGHAGLGPADPYGDSPEEAVELLAMLNIGAVVMGTALAIRDLRGKQRIFRREQANGLSASAFLAAKIIVYGLVASIQIGIVTIVAVVGKGAPTHGAVLLGNPVVELFLTLAITAIVSAIVALALSSLTIYTEQIVLAAVLITLISLVFSGGMFPLAGGQVGLEQISWFVPSRWGFAASASTVDVSAVNLLADADKWWIHSPGRWLFDMAVLVVFGAVATALLRIRLSRPARQRDER